MSNNSNQQHGPYLNSGHHVYIPYWKRAHNDWRFWGGVLLMFVAILIYVASDDLALRSRPQQQSALSGAVGK
jgi:hypothetical protein